MRIALLLGLLGCSSAPLIAPLELAEARDVFNAGASGPRMIVFFSSGCAACDTGSQALQETLQTTSGPITVLAVGLEAILPDVKNQLLMLQR